MQIRTKDRNVCQLVSNKNIAATKNYVTKYNVVKYNE